MKHIFTLFFVFIQSSIWCQDEVFSFYPLTVIGEISDTNELKSLVKADSLSKKDFFFTENYKENNGLFFVKKEKDNWVVYEFELSLGSNSFLKSIKQENSRFVSIQFYRSPSGMCSSLYGIIFLLDITRNEYISFYNFNEQICYDYEGENVVARESECKATFSIKGDFLKITSSKKPDDGLQCIKSGTYQYENGKFVRHK